MGDLVKLILQLGIKCILDRVCVSVGWRIDLYNSQWRGGCLEGGYDDALSSCIPVKAAAPDSIGDGNGNPLSGKAIGSARVHDCVSSYLLEARPRPSDFGPTTQANFVLGQLIQQQLSPSNVTGGI